MVTALEMIEIEMGNRGSKSNIFESICKRATSRWFFSISNTVRCTLVAGKPVPGEIIYINFLGLNRYTYY